MSLRDRGIPIFVISSYDESLGELVGALVEELSIGWEEGRADVSSKDEIICCLKKGGDGPFLEVDVTGHLI